MLAKTNAFITRCQCGCQCGCQWHCPCALSSNMALKTVSHSHEASIPSRTTLFPLANAFLHKQYRIKQSAGTKYTNTTGYAHFQLFFPTCVGEVDRPRRETGPTDRTNTQHALLSPCSSLSPSHSLQFHSPPLIHAPTCVGMDADTCACLQRRSGLAHAHALPPPPAPQL